MGDRGFDLVLTLGLVFEGNGSMLRGVVESVSSLVVEKLSGTQNKIFFSSGDTYGTRKPHLAWKGLGIMPKYLNFVPANIQFAKTASYASSRNICGTHTSYVQHEPTPTHTLLLFRICPK